jgi:hypothetical protein
MIAAYVSHQCSGRLRVKIPSKRGDHGYLNEMKETISAQTGVRTVKINPLTGSLLIIHDLDSDQILRSVTSKKLFSFEVWKSQPTTHSKLFSINGWKPDGKEMPAVQRRMTETYKRIDKYFMTLTRGEINIPGVIFYSLLGLGAYQIYVGNLGLQNIPFLIVIWFLANILWYEWNM